jgi:hypothetical protein
VKKKTKKTFIIYIYQPVKFTIGLWVIEFNATFNNISVTYRGSQFLMEETGVLEENHRPVASH